MVTDPPDDVFKSINPIELADKASAYISDLWSEIARTVILIRQGKAHWSDVSTLLQQIDVIQADLRMAGLAVGLLSPWMHDAVSMASASVALITASPETIPRDRDGIRRLLGTLPESERQELIEFLSTRNGFDVDLWRSISAVTRYSPATAAYRFPRIEEGVKFLAARNVVTESQWSRLAAAEKVRTVYLPGAKTETVNKLRSALSESFRDGESLADFRKRIDGVTDATRFQVETLFRTQTKQAYLDGVTTILDSPKIGAKFPAVLYQATSDNRTRPLHKVWDGKVIGVDSPEYQTAKAMQAEYNCRCTLIPLTEKRAKEMGWNGGTSAPEKKSIGEVNISGNRMPVTANESSSSFGGGAFNRINIKLETTDRGVGSIEVVHDVKNQTVGVRASDAIVRSQGVGQMLYGSAIEKALSVGAKSFTSDRRVSSSAVNAWRRLAKSRKVEERPHTIDADGSYRSTDGGPVFVVSLD